MFLARRAQSQRETGLHAVIKKLPPFMQHTYGAHCVRSAKYGLWMRMHRTH